MADYVNGAVEWAKAADWAEIGACTWAWTFYVLGWCAVVSVSTHLLPLLYSWFLCGDQDLKKKYNASWGLVTGGSSGIGFSIAQKLAHQGVNVVIAAVDDSILHSSVERLQKDFPDVEVRSVGVDLARDGYMDTIKKATDDVDVQLVFVNAGFVRTGLFAASPVGVPMANFNVNATHAIQVSHHFIVRMRETGLRGCVCFTSSPAFLIPTPLTAMYGSTKAFVTEFAASIAAETRSDGIDVCVVHPSPTRTRFYEGNRHGVGAMQSAEKGATGPDRIADALFSAVGRVVVRDQGTYTLTFRMISKLFDALFLTEIFTRFGSMSPDFRNVLKDGAPKKQTAPRGSGRTGGGKGARRGASPGAKAKQS